jgi:ribosomal protein S18 acetylase RimI-like enzyme
MKIRNAQSSDVNAVFKLGNSVKQFEVAKDTVYIWPKKILLKIANSNSDVFLVAEENKNIIGFVIANYNKNFSKATMENIFVAPEFRNKGVGEKLFKSAIDKLKKLKCEYVCGLVNTKNKKVISWCVKQGFEKGLNFNWLDKTLSKSFHKKN